MPKLHPIFQKIFEPYQNNLPGTRRVTFAEPPSRNWLKNIEPELDVEIFIDGEPPTK